MARFSFAALLPVACGEGVAAHGVCGPVGGGFAAGWLDAIPGALGRSFWGCVHTRFVCAPWRPVRPVSPLIPAPLGHLSLSYSVSRWRFIN